MPADLDLARHSRNMATPTKDLKELEAEQAKEDADMLAELDNESKEFDKVDSMRSSYFNTIDTHISLLAGLRNRPS